MHAGIFLVGGGGGGGGLVGSLSTTQKIVVSSMSHVPHCFEPKCWFCNFQAVSGHFAQINPHQLTRFGKTWHV